MTGYAIKPLDSQIDHRPSLIPRIPSILNVVSPIGEEYITNSLDHGRRVFQGQIPPDSYFFADFILG